MVKGGCYGVLSVLHKAGSDLLWDVLPSEVLPLPWFHFLIICHYVDKDCAGVVPFGLLTPASKPLPLIPCLEGVGRVVVKDQYLVEGL